jgi:hypothetical protein
MLTKFFGVLLLLAVTALTASAQLDQARGGPYGDFTSKFNDMVRYAEQKDRDAALSASDEMARALNSMFDYSKDVPGRLNDGGLRELASQAQAFMDSIQEFRNRGSALQDKLKRTGEDYSSELSNIKSAMDSLKEKFNTIWGNLQLAGRALKAACSSGCIP